MATLITTVNELQDMNLDLAGDYELANDIDASATAGWNGGLGFEPIGTSAAPFTGTFDGKGFTITGLTINRPLADDVGLFGNVNFDTSSVVIKDVTLASVDITAKGEVGALIGYAHKSADTTDRLTISGCTSSGSVVSSPGTTYNYAAGGLFGTIWVSGEGYLSISGCNSSCSVVSPLGSAGGLFGYLDCRYALSAKITECYATGAVSGYQYNGGLIGFLRGHTGGWPNSIAVISECYAAGYVTSEGATPYGAGGFVGYAEGVVILDCYARGGALCEGLDPWGVGGFVGEGYNADYEDCYATGKPEVVIIGGIWSDYVGGFVGYEWESNFSSCAWDTDTSGVANACGSGAVTGVTGYTTAELKDITTITAEGWDVFDIWNILSAINDGYPSLRWQYPVPVSIPSVIGDRTVVIEKPVLELIRNLEMQFTGRFFISRQGDAVYESRYHRSA